MKLMDFIMIFFLVSNYFLIFSQNNLKCYEKQLKYLEDS